jgi:hypothetical protein
MDRGNWRMGRAESSGKVVNSIRSKARNTGEAYGISGLCQRRRRQQRRKADERARRRVGRSPASKRQRRGRAPSALPVSRSSRGTASSFDYFFFWTPEFDVPSRRPRRNFAAARSGGEILPSPATQFFGEPLYSTEPPAGATPGRPPSPELVSLHGRGKRGAGIRRLLIRVDGFRVDRWSREFPW